ELIGGGAVDDSMIERKRKDDHRSNCDCVVDHDRALLDSAHTHNRDLRLIDDGRADQSAVLPGICDRKRSILYIIRSELLVAGTVTEIVQGARDPEKIL